MKELVYKEDPHDFYYKRGLKIIKEHKRQSLRIFDQGYQRESFSDFDSCTEDAKDVKVIASLFSDVISKIKEQHKFDYLFFLDKEGKSTIGAIKLAGLLSYFTGKPNLIIRLDHDIVTTRLKISSEKKRKEHKSGILIVDHISTGKEVVDAINIAEASGKKITDIISFTILTNNFQEKYKIEKKEIKIYGLYYQSVKASCQ